jgi:hypothetical protein
MTAVHHPAPLNQFYRLDRDTPTSPYVKTTRWNHVHVDGNGHVINWDGTLCMSTLGAIGLDAHTGGTKRTSPGGIHDKQDDRIGGIGVDDVKVAWARGWSQTLYVPSDFDWNDTLYAVRAQRRFAIIGVDYGFVPYAYQAQKGGDFPHAMGIDDYRATDGRIRVYDSLAANPQWMPQSAIRPAAEALAVQERGTKTRLFVAFTRSRPLLDQEELYQVAITGGSAHSTPLYDKPYGRKVSHVSTATYVCTRHKVDGQWWYQILPTARTANRGLWISPTRYTKVSYA